MTLLETLSEIEKFAQAATPGPWMADKFQTIWTVLYSRDPQLPVGINSWSFDLFEDPSEETAKHIAQMNPNTTLALVAALREAVEALDFYAKGSANSYWDICHYTLDGGAGARNALTHINELFEKEGK